MRPGDAPVAREFRDGPGSPDLFEQLRALLRISDVRHI